MEELIKILILSAVVYFLFVLHSGKWDWWIQDSPEVIKEKINDIQYQIDSLKENIADGSAGKYLTNKYFRLIEEKRKLENKLHRIYK